MKRFYPAILILFVFIACSKEEQAIIPSDTHEEEHELLANEVCGYVKYSDGSPASGVSVSNGFRIKVTNKNGYYYIGTNEDVRHIYISYPADAVIQKNENGCPAFFIPLEHDRKSYDFTLERQAVENEFTLFAMADPQVHYQVLYPQKQSNTERFLKESVPAINRSISESKLPCYGVTLGDIVYSQASRNSTPAMNVMRNYMGQLNMPVFQTMGNHDYTFFHETRPLKTGYGSTTLYLRAQRTFEECFGPVNFSFNRGNVHIVCMRNIIFDSDIYSAQYHGGFTDQQYLWLKNDLANVSKDKMVILCVHIPIADIIENENVRNVLKLLKEYPNATVFSGHLHAYRGVENLDETGIAEYVHNAVCGQWWWSNISGDGCPNGFTVYTIKGNQISNSLSQGINAGMDSADYQIRMYKGGITTGGPYAYFKWGNNDRAIFINVFHGDSRWKVKVFENGKYAGNAKLMANSSTSFQSVSAGNTYDIPFYSSQDWWTIGYHIGVIGQGTNNKSYYTAMHHMFKWTASSTDAEISVEATDPYGNVYECSDIIDNADSYPEYIKAELDSYD